MRLVILFDILLNPSFKVGTSFVNIVTTTASTSKFIYYERFQNIRNWVFMCKIIFNLNEAKTILMLKLSLQNLIWCERLLIYGNLKH